MLVIASFVSQIESKSYICSSEKIMLAAAQQGETLVGLFVGPLLEGRSCLSDKSSSSRAEA